MAPPVKKRKILVGDDIWTNILPFFRLPQLGLNIALLSSRYDSLVDTHFDDKRELTIWRDIHIYKDTVQQKARMTINGRVLEFASLDRPLPVKICFKICRIHYIDHAVINFFRSNKPLWDRGVNLHIHLHSYKKCSKIVPIWRVFTREILPLLTTTNVRLLYLERNDQLDKLRREISPTILSDLNLRAIFSHCVAPDASENNAQNPTAGQTLAKWLHIPNSNGKPKQLFCGITEGDEWVDSFKEVFNHATTSVRYTITFQSPRPIDPFELTNEQTNEKLTLTKKPRGFWLLKRCPIGETATVQQNDPREDPFYNVHFHLGGDANCLGPLTAPAEGQSNDEEEVPSRPGPSGAWEY